MLSFFRNIRRSKEGQPNSSKCIVIGLLVAVVFILGSKTADHLIKNLSSRERTSGEETYILVEGVEIPIPGAAGQLSEEETEKLNRRIQEVAVEARTIEIGDKCQFSPPAVRVSIEEGSDVFKFVNKTAQDYTLIVPSGPEEFWEITIPAEGTSQVAPSELIRITQGTIGISCKGENPGFFIYIGTTSQ